MPYIIFYHIYDKLKVKLYIKKDTPAQPVNIYCYLKYKYTLLIRDMVPEKNITMVHCESERGTV